MAEPETASFANVLVVDPSAKVREIVSGLLRHVGIPKVLSCSSPVEAARLLASGNVDLIICGNSFNAGFALVNALRWAKDSPRRDAVVLLMDKTDNHGFLDTTRDMGIDSILLVPFNGNTLRQRLQSISAVKYGLIESEFYVGPDRRRALRHREGEDRRQKAPPPEMIYHRSFNEILKQFIEEWKGRSPVHKAPKSTNSANTTNAAQGGFCHVADLKEGVILSESCMTTAGVSVVSKYRPLSNMTIARLRDMVRLGEMEDRFYPIN